MTPETKVMFVKMQLGLARLLDMQRDKDGKIPKPVLNRLPTGIEKLAAMTIEDMYAIFGMEGNGK